MQRDQPQPDEPELEIATLDESAALWSECLREAGDDGEVRAAFERWRDRDPAHAEAFDRVDAARAAVESVAEEPEIMGLRNESLSRVAMQRVAAERAPPIRHRRRRPPRLGTVAAGVAAVAVGAALLLAYQPNLRYGVYDRVVALATGTEIYRTGVGQRSTVTLDDGSTLALNTDSLIRVAYDENARHVNLEHGQALFEVAKDRSRPFVVDSNGHRVTALGTAFDVRKSENTIEVTLIEGRVTVERTAPPESDGRPAERESATRRPDTVPESWLEAAGGQRTADGERLILEPGQQFVDAGDLVPVVRVADVDRVTSWREGRVTFDDDDLSAVVAEMNRYSHRRIVLGDRRLADLEVSGAFDTDKTDIFIEALLTYFPIRVIERDNDKIVLAWNG